MLGNNIAFSIYVLSVSISVLFRTYNTLYVDVFKCIVGGIWQIIGNFRQLGQCAIHYRNSDQSIWFWYRTVITINISQMLFYAWSNLCYCRDCRFKNCFSFLCVSWILHWLQWAYLSLMLNLLDPFV